MGYCFLSGRSQESGWGSNCQPGSWEEEAEGSDGEGKPVAMSRPMARFSLWTDVCREEGKIAEEKAPA